MRFWFTELIVLLLDVCHQTKVLYLYKIKYTVVIFLKSVWTDNRAILI